MQVKLMMLLSDKKSKKICECAETILYEVAGAFEHRFSILYEKIGQLSLAAYGSELTEETIEACQSCAGVIASDSNAPGMSELQDALCIALKARYFGIPQSLCGKHEKGYHLWIASVPSLDSATIQQAFGFAFDFAEQNDLVLTHVCPNGKASAYWKEEMNAQALIHSGISVHEKNAPDAICTLIEHPADFGILLSPEYAGSIFKAAAATLNPIPHHMRDIALGNKIGVYAPTSSQDTLSEAINPVPVALAVSDFLRYSAGLRKEADCISAAVDNVIEAGWHTSSMGVNNEDTLITSEKMVELICDQISLAGQFMNPSGGLK